MGVLNYSAFANQTFTNIPQAPNVITMSPTTEVLLIVAVAFGIFSIVMSMVSKRNKHRIRTNAKKEHERLMEEEKKKKSETNKKEFEQRTDNDSKD